MGLIQDTGEEAVKDIFFGQYQKQLSFFCW
jgi:hypothetical protein